MHFANPEVEFLELEPLHPHVLNILYRQIEGVSVEWRLPLPKGKSKRQKDDKGPFGAGDLECGSTGTNVVSVCRT